MTDPAVDIHLISRTDPAAIPVSEVIAAAGLAALAIWLVRFVRDLIDLRNFAFDDGDA